MSVRNFHRYKRVHLYLPLACIIFAIIAFGADSAPVILSLCLVIFAGAGLLAFRSWKVESPSRALAFGNAWLIVMLSCAVCLVSVAAMQGHLRAFEHEYLSLFLIITLFWFGNDVGRADRGFGRAVQSLVVLAGIYGLFSFSQHGLSPDKIFGFEKPYHKDRLTGTFLSANTAATVFGVFIFFAISNTYRNWVNWRSERTLFERVMPSILVAAVCLWCLVLTKSTAGIAMFTLTFIGMLACGIHYHWALGARKPAPLHARLLIRSPMRLVAKLVNFSSIVWGIILGLGGVSFILICWDIFPLNHENIQAAFSDRRHMYDVLWRAFQDKPYAGYGLGRLDTAKSMFVTLESNYAVTGQHAAHNIILQWLVQSGLIFTLVMLGLYISILLYISSGLKFIRHYWVHILAVVASSVYIALHGLFDYALEIPAIVMFHAWILGLGCGYVQKARFLDSNESKVETSKKR